MVIKKRMDEISASGKYVKWLSELSKDSGSVAGGKGANLAEMYNSGFPVPPAFCITAQAFDAYLVAAGLKAEINRIIKDTDIDNTKELDVNAKKIREIITKSEMPEEMSEEIIEAYEILSTDQEVKKAESRFVVSKSALDILKNSHESVFVAVRSSATTEDLATASFAGQQDTYTNIKGNKELILAVKKCFASLYTARAVYYRKKKGFKEGEALLSVTVQKMVNSDKSGVVFTKNPVSGANEIIMEAVFGLGEGIVSGKIKPDHYVINPDLDIVEKKIADKKVAIVRQADGEEKTVTLTPEKSKQQVMSDAEIKSLAYTVQKIEEHYKKPQDIEFAVETGRIFIVQSRPVTTIEKSSAIKKQILSGNVLLSGMPASPGVAFGPVKLVHTLDDLEKIMKGDILVTKMTNPDMVVAMQRCSAIITDEGGATAHAAIVSREMGIPCFSGDTIIMTDKGFINLADANNRILNGEIIHTLSFDIQKLKTEWKQILNTSKRQSPTITISASKNGQVEWNTLTTTPEHKFFSFESRVPCYKKINEILANESIIYSANKMPILPQILTINPQKAYTCGAIFSDGYLRIKKGGGGSTVFAQKSTPQKMEFINEVCKNFENVYDYKLRWVRPSYYYCYSKKITEDLLNIYDNINKIILGLDEYSIIKYLASIIDGDGNFIERGKVIKISIDAKDVNLLQSLVLSCMRLGLNYRIRKEDNQFRFYITSGIEKLKPYLKRVIVTNYEKTTGDTYFSAKHLFLDIPICGRKGIKSFVKNNCLLSEREIAEKIIPFVKDNSLRETLSKFVNSNIGALRVKKISDNAVEDVYNIEVADNNNYIVFTKLLTPLIVKNCVVATETATQTLKDGQIVTVDGSGGKVYDGKVEEKIAEGVKEILPIVRGTKTKIKVMVDLPSFAERAAKSQADAVGLMRLEGIIAESGKHPLYYVKNGNPHEYRDVIEDGVSKISKHFKEIWVRTSDIRTDEFRHLKGAPAEVEVNPMLGFHGIRFSLKNIPIMEAEIEAVSRVAEKNPTKKFGLMFPQVISEEEMAEAYKIYKKFQKPNLIIGTMIETPAAVQVIRGICKYAKFISFGTNDLTQFTLAIDRGNAECQYMYNEMHPAILSQLRRVIDVCKEYKVETSICGQAGSKKEMVEFLVRQGIDSISVNADMAHDISQYVLELETKLKSQGNKNNNPSKKPSVLPVDDMSEIEEKENEKVADVEKRKMVHLHRKDSKTEVVEEKESAEEEKEDNDNKKEAEEYPVFEIGFDPFKEVR